MCEEFNLSKWSEKLIRNKLIHLCDMTEDNKLNTILKIVKEVTEERNLYHESEDFPKNAEDLGKLWENGDVNGLKIGDRVQFKYILNVDGMNSEEIRMIRSCQDEFATVVEFKGCESLKQSKYIKVNFDDKELNEINMVFLPMQFIKNDEELKDKAIFNLNRNKVIRILNNMVKYQENLDKEELVDILDTMSKDLQKMKEEI